NVLGTAIVSERYSTIAEEVHHAMLRSGKTLSLAESCTGGMLSSMIVEHAGSSAYLMHSLVTYANEAKVHDLGVPQSVLDQFGAVSLQTALAMAHGARRRLDTDYGLAVTGIAGPDGGSADKPVGTVCIALVNRERCWAQTLNLG